VKIKFTCIKCKQEVTVTVKPAPVRLSKNAPRSHAHVVECPKCGATQTVAVSSNG